MINIIQTPSPNFNARQLPVTLLVLHYTGMPTMQQALDRLRDPAAAVSAHYLVDEDGTVYQLVDEASRAWHAGISSWAGETDINSAAIGIEIVNPGHEFGYRKFPAAQIVALIILTKDILTRYDIPPQNIVGHADIAPARKQDPGELFPWDQLAAAGISNFHCK